MNRAAIVVIAAFAVFGLLPASTRAALLVSSSVTPTEIHDSTRSITVKLEIINTGEAQVFSLGFKAPRLIRRGTNPPVGEGSPITLATPLPISSGSIVEGQSASVYALPVCSPTENIFHGFERHDLATDYSMPAISTASVEYRFAVIRRPVESRAVFVPSFSFSDRLTNGTIGTIPERWVHRPIQPVNSRAVSASIYLRTDPLVSDGANRRASTVRVGRKLIVRGRVIDATRKARVIIKTVKPGSRSIKRIRVVQTDRNGFFRFRWRADQPGMHQIWAMYPKQSGKFRPDYRCPIIVNAR